VNLVRRRLLIIATTIVCALAVLAGAATWWWRWDTSRQPRVDDVVAAMNTAVADTVTAAGPDAAVAVSPVVPSAECPLGPFRRGHTFTAKADLYTDPGSEDALITTIEQRLPAGYATTRGVAVAGIRPLQAAIGATVTLSVRRLSPGWLTVNARSQCSLGTATTPPPPGGNPPGAAALTQILAQLGTRPAGITEQRLRCATGDIVTISVISEPIDTGRLDSRLTAIVPAAAHRFATGEANRISYRDRTTSVIIAASDDGTAISAQHTTTC
jgi:hypothetical protein